MRQMPIELYHVFFTHCDLISYEEVPHRVISFSPCCFDRLRNAWKYSGKSSWSPSSWQADKRAWAPSSSSGADERWTPPQPSPSSTPAVEPRQPTEPPPAHLLAASDSVAAIAAATSSLSASHASQLSAIVAQLTAASDYTMRSMQATNNEQLVNTMQVLVAALRPPQPASMVHMYPPPPHPSVVQAAVDSAMANRPAPPPPWRAPQSWTPLLPVVAPLATPAAVPAPVEPPPNPEMPADEERHMCMLHIIRIAFI